MTEEVVITGMGVVSPIGVGVQPFWEALVSGVSGIALIRRFDTTGYAAHFGAEVVDFDPAQYLDTRVIREGDRFMLFGLAAMRMALDQAHWSSEQEKDPYRVGVTFGTSIGGIETIETEEQTFLKRGPSRVSPRMIPRMLPNMAANEAGILWGMRGPSLTYTAACASSALALGEAKRLITSGVCDAVLVGGGEAVLTPLGFAGICQTRAVSTRNDDPSHACRPFDKLRDGMVMGEGGAALFVESATHAQARGVDPLAYLIGYGSYGDGYHATAPAPDGHGEIAAMRAALEDAHVAAEEVGYINAHGTSTPLGDRVEAEAIAHLFGPMLTRLPVSSIKGATGHLMGAGGAAEAIATILALQTGILPPTLNYEVPDPQCPLDVVPNESREVAGLRYALSNSFGFGGQNASLLFRSI
ncbi:MAG: beta-ketoacyl-ACP synthase II [Firmicutes bacterium]|nr:beta-ketoacyl-ACP synthase II [Bacillota bacterium]